MTDTDYRAIQPIVSRVSSRLARDWSGISPDDISQEIYVHLVANWDSICRQAESIEQRRRLVKALAEREGYGFCAGERYTFQHYSAEWIYTPKEVRRILPDFFNGDAFKEAPKRPEGTNQTLEGDGLCIPAMDIRSAFEQLAEPEQVILIRAYHHHESLDTSDRKRTSRAVEKIVSILNRGVIDRFDHSDHDGPGSRQVMTNAQSRAAASDCN